MWYTFQSLCRDVLKEIAYPPTADDDLTVRLVPQFIEAFAASMPAKINYRIATGTVELMAIQPVQRIRISEVEMLQPDLVTGDVAPHKRILARPRVGYVVKAGRRTVKVPRTVGQPLDPATFAVTKSALAADIQRQFT